MKFFAGKRDGAARTVGACGNPHGGRAGGWIVGVVTELYRNQLLPLLNPPLVADFFASPAYSFLNLQYSGVRQRAQVIQQGESPCLAKPNQQPVLSLGAIVVRRGLSVGRGV